MSNFRILENNVWALGLVLYIILHMMYHEKLSFWNSLEYGCNSVLSTQSKCPGVKIST